MINNKTHKIICVFVLLTIIVFSSIHLFKEKGYRIAIEEQAYLRCLPYELSLIHETKVYSADINKNMLVVINTKNHSKYFDADRKLLKVVVGRPGDIINMRNDQLKVNDILYGNINLKDTFPPYSNNEFTLKDGEYFVMGTTKVSLDSRIIGPVNIDDIEGIGYAIL